LSVGRPRGRELVRARRERSHRREAGAAGREAGAAATGGRRARAGHERRRRPRGRDPRAAAGRARRLHSHRAPAVGELAAERVQVETRRAQKRRRRREEHMAEYKLNILTPSVNNLCVRIFVRAAGLDFEEVDVWGKTMSPEFLAKYPAHLTPMLETDGLPSGALGESCAIMAFLCNKHGLDRFYPTDPGRRAMGYLLPDWAEEYIARIEETLGNAYSEPAKDVRDYVASVKPQQQARAPA